MLRNFNIAPYLDIIYAILVWSYCIVFIGLKRIRELLPVAILSAIILFISSIDLIVTGLYSFDLYPFSFGGVPLFLLVWGAGAGIIVMHYMKAEFVKKFVLVVFFSLIALAASYISESLGASILHGRFNQLSDLFQNFVILVLLVWISEGLWGNKIYKQNQPGN